MHLNFMYSSERLHLQNCLNIVRVSGEVSRWGGRRGGRRGGGGRGRGGGGQDTQQE